jgi:hypothetical protein
VAAFRFSRRAEADLLSIGDYTLRTWGKAQAARYRAISGRRNCCRDTCAVEVHTANWVAVPDSRDPTRTAKAGEGARCQRANERECFTLTRNGLMESPR